MKPELDEVEHNATLLVLASLIRRRRARGTASRFPHRRRDGASVVRKRRFARASLVGRFHSSVGGGRIVFLRSELLDYSHEARRRRAGRGAPKHAQGAMTVTISEHAILAAKLGPVFALFGMNGRGCACGNPRCRHPAKHPRQKGWQEKATTDPVAIGRIFSDDSTNIGLRTGDGCTPGESRAFVIDVDPRHGGDDTLAELELQHGPLPETIRAQTGGGGEHIFFRIPLESRFRAVPSLRAST